MRLVITYVLIALIGVAVSAGVAVLVGRVLPVLRLPMFVVIMLLWVWIGWKYAEARGRGES